MSKFTFFSPVTSKWSTQNETAKPLKVMGKIHHFITLAYYYLGLNMIISTEAKSEVL